MIQQKDNLLNQGAPESTGRPTLSALRGRQAEPSLAGAVPAALMLAGREPATVPLETRVGSGPALTARPQTGHVGLGPSADGSDPASPLLTADTSVLCTQ